MARQIYGADGSAQVVSTTGVPTVAAATVYTARTGGTIVTDIQNLSNANLGGVVTPDARGQIIFQGPDNSTATYWLDFGDGGPRWGVRPVDISAMMTAAMVAAVMPAIFCERHIRHGEGADRQRRHADDEFLHRSSPLHTFFHERIFAEG